MVPSIHAARELVALCQHGLPRIVAWALLLILNISNIDHTLIDAVEFFAGDAAVTKGLMRQGLRTLSYDMRYDSSMNLNSSAGFARKTQFVKARAKSHAHTTTA